MKNIMGALPCLFSSSLTVSATTSFSGKTNSVDTLNELGQEWNTVLGKEPADLLIKNVKIVNVYTEKIYPGSILIKKGKIVALDPPEHVEKAANAIFDGKEMYAIPGLIDTHFHIDSQLVTPAAMAECIVPYGTTSAFCEILDIVSAAKSEGVKAAKYLFRDYGKLPYRIWIAAPGKKVELNIVKELLDWELVNALGECNQNDYLQGSELEKLSYARAKGKMILGHVKFPDSPYQVNLFSIADTVADHNPFNYEEAEWTLRHGIGVMIREGIGLLANLEPIMSGVIKNNIPTENLMFSTDNISVDTMLNRGHINYAVQKAIDLGLRPIEAIKMGSYNAARKHGLEHEIGSLTPGRYADILLLKDLDRITPAYVFKGGKLVAEDGKLLKEVEIDYSDIITTKAKPGLNGLKPEDLLLQPAELSSDGKLGKVKILNTLQDGKPFFRNEWLPYEDNKIMPNLQGLSLTSISLIERYPKTHKRHIINAFTAGVDLGNGAIGISYPSPSDYIGVIGHDDEERYYAAKKLDEYPGCYLVTAEKEVKAILPLPIYSIMSDLKPEELLRKTDALINQGRMVGYKKPGPPWYYMMLILMWNLERYKLIF